MQAKHILAAGKLVAMYENSKATVKINPDAIRAKQEYDITDTIVLVRDTAPDLDVPDPSLQTAEWDELRALVRKHTGLTVAYVSSPEGSFYLVVKIDLPFSVCMAGPQIWLTAIKDAVRKKHNAATSEFDQLMDRIVR